MHSSAQSVVCLTCNGNVPAERMEEHKTKAHPMVTCERCICAYPKGKEAEHLTQCIVPVVEATQERVPFYSGKSNRDFIKACIDGNLKDVRMMLRDRNIDPGCGNGDPIQYAAKHGHLEIVKVLLADSRVKPDAWENLAFRFAAENGNLEIAKILLADLRVQPNSRDNYAIQYAAQNGHIEMVKFLLSDARVNPTTNNNAAIIEALKHRHFAVVKLLMADPRVIPE